MSVESIKKDISCSCCSGIISDMYNYMGDCGHHYHPSCFKSLSNSGATSCSKITDIDANKSCQQKIDFSKVISTIAKYLTISPQYQITPLIPTIAAAPIISPVIAAQANIGAILPRIISEDGSDIKIIKPSDGVLVERKNEPSKVKLSSESIKVKPSDGVKLESSKVKTTNKKSSQTWADITDEEEKENEIPVSIFTDAMFINTMNKCGKGSSYMLPIRQMDNVVCSKSDYQKRFPMDDITDHKYCSFYVYILKFKNEELRRKTLTMSYTDFQIDELVAVLEDKYKSEDMNKIIYIHGSKFIRPCSKDIPKILSILQKKGLKVSFHCIGYRDTTRENGLWVMSSFYYRYG